MISKKKLIGMFLLSFLLEDVSAFAQKLLTLKECINYSLNNNINIKIANYNVDISQKKVTEQIGNYLPQINVSGELDDNLILTTQLMPAEMMGGTPGTYVPVTFGNRYSLSGSVQVKQKLYDPTDINGVKSAKINKEMSVQTLQKTNEQTVFNVSLAYYQTLVIQMQINVLKSTLTASGQSLKSINLKNINGMAKKIDVDKMRVSYNNTKSQLEQAGLSYSQSLNTLKYYMGMPVDSSMAIADTTISMSNIFFYDDSKSAFEMGNIIDYQLQESNISLAQIDKKTKKAAFLPVLSFYGNFNYNAMRQEFNFFDADKDWYNSASIGLKLSVPIFDGFQRNSKLAQSELNIKVTKEKLLLTEQSIKVDITNYEIQYKNAIDNIKREKENLDLAERVYMSTQLEYNQGASSTLELIQSESSYMEAQNIYFNKLLNLYIARIELENARGTLMNFYQQLK